MKRRGFIAALLGLATAPFVAKAVSATKPAPLAFHPDAFSFVWPTTEPLPTRHDVLYGYANVRPDVDLRFYSDDRWPDSVVEERQALGRPCLTINRIPKFIAHIK